MKSSINIILITLLIILHFSCVIHAQPTIQLKLKKGEQYILNQTTTIENIQKFDNEDYIVTTALTGSTTFIVRDETNDVYSMDVTMDKISFKVSTHDMSVEINTEKEAPVKDSIIASVMYDMLTSITGKSFLVKMNKNGDILQVTGINELFRYSLTILSRKYGINEDVLQQYTKQMVEVFGDASMKNSLSSTFAIYPGNKPINNKGQWTKEVPVHAMMKGTNKIVYTLKDTTDSDVSISGAGKSSVQNEEPIEISGYKLRYKLSSVYNLDIVLDKESFWIKGGTIDNTTSGSVTYISDKEIKVPMSIITKTSL